MIDIGVGIAIAGVAVAAAPVAITAIRVKSNGKIEPNGVCPLHSGIETSLEYLKQGQERIEEKLDKAIAKGG